MTKHKPSEGRQGSPGVILDGYQAVWALDQDTVIVADLQAREVVRCFAIGDLLGWQGTGAGSFSDHSLCSLVVDGDVLYAVLAQEKECAIALSI